MLASRATLLACLALAAAALVPSQPVAQDGSTAAADDTPLLVVPLANAEEGKRLFVGKACVVCHAVNGVGGKAAPPLDAARETRLVAVLDFAARMWRGAPTMILLQEMELGYQIELSGEEIAHLAAFAADAEVQGSFRESDIPEVIRDWMVDEVYRELDLDNMAQ